MIFYLFYHKQSHIFGQDFFHSSSNNLIEVCDSEDEEISRAIEASIHDNQAMR